MGVFDDYPIAWNGKNYVIPAGAMLGAIARIEDVVNLTCFLASARADYMTGQAINITGGREMH